MVCNSEPTKLGVQPKVCEDKFSHFQLYLIEPTGAYHLWSVRPVFAVALGMSHSRMFDNAITALLNRRRDDGAKTSTRLAEEGKARSG
jgi:hypothetical protein